MSETSACPTVHVLLATYNGARFLDAQLQSLAEQTWKNWTLTISDDGSTDGTLEIVKKFAAASEQKISVIEGPRLGSTQNFFHLLQSTQVHENSNLFAFCDQDDIWLPQKLSKAVSAYRVHTAPSQPFLYCGRTSVVNAELKPLGMTDLPRRGLTFSNALTQNIASGNTMVFNHALTLLMLKVNPLHSVWHDWTAYQVATGCGGVVAFDPIPMLLYRQHGANVIGSKDGLLSRLLRVGSLLDGRYRIWCGLTELAIKDLEAHLTPQARTTFAGFRLARSSKSPIERLRHAKNVGLFRQSTLGQIALLASFALGLA
jgi:glycosyltransferase involved in cell wall biosynthesis